MHFNWAFWVLSENFSLRWLSVRGNYFISGSAYVGTISSLAELTQKSNISVESNTIFKNRVLQTLEIRDDKDSVFAKKFLYKIQACVPLWHDDFVTEVYYRSTRLYQKGENYNGQQ